jgi:hypothetical protein
MATIDVDFEVYKELTSRRPTESTSYNEVIRKLLGWNPQTTAVSNEGSQAWEYKGARFPHGTDFRAPYRGRTYLAKVEDGKLIYDERPMNSPSEAAHAVTGTSVNGWKFWECRLPGTSKWRSIEALR